eukprot:12407879-Karenia_brevis.AAC.1
MQILAKVLYCPDVSGLKKLREDREQTSYSPKRMEKIQTLYRAMNRSGGELSKQHGESMMRFTKRRERVWMLPKQMSPEVQMDDELRGHL